MKTRIVIIDDHELVLQGMHNKLETVPEFKLVGSYVAVEGLLFCLTHNQVDVVVMDLMLKGIHGFDLVKKIRQEIGDEIKIILISGFYEEMLHQRALELGVKAFLRKEASYDELISCIVNVAKGNHVIPDFLVRPIDNPILSKIERKVLQLIVNEYTNEKIARELFISRRTVESHTTNIYRKLKVNSRIGAVREALKLHLV